MTIWNTIKENPSVLVWAIVVHLLAFIAIGISFKSSEPKISSVKEEKVIEAVAIDERKIEEEINKLKKADLRKKRDQRRLQDNVQKAKNDRRKEEKKLLALKKKQQEQEKINKNKRIQENKRLAELEKRRLEQEQQEKEAQKKLDELEKIRLEKKAQLEKEEKQRQEKIAQQKLAAEQKQRAEYELSEVAKYTGLIKGQITRNWIFPASYQKGMKCKILVRLIPSGDVVSVQVIQSSGNSAFDRSVEMAVNKASPLPVPKSSTGLFDHFREVEFVFDPNA
jgi:colicin import membrane protein